MPLSLRSDPAGNRAVVVRKNVELYIADAIGPAGHEKILTAVWAAGPCATARCPIQRERAQGSPVLAIRGQNGSPGLSRPGRSEAAIRCSSRCESRPDRTPAQVEAYKRLPVFVAGEAAHAVVSHMVPSGTSSTPAPHRLNTPFSFTRYATRRSTAFRWAPGQRTGSTPSGCGYRAPHSGGSAGLARARRHVDLRAGRHHRGAVPNGRQQGLIVGIGPVLEDPRHGLARCGTAPIRPLPSPTGH